jgi:hypothetical protein
VDVDVDLARGPVSSVRLTDLVATRVDDAWRFTRGTVCGLAAQATALGQISTCSDPGAPDRIAGDVDLALTLVGDVGDPVEVADSVQVVTGWWGTGVERIGTDWWFLDYPEEELGGGGPVGPADLVRTDSGGRETARVSLAGTDATVLTGDDVIWVAHTVADPADGSWTRTLTAVDAGSARVLAELELADTEAAVAGIGDDVVVLDGTLLHVHDGRTLRRTNTVMLPDPYFPDRVRVAPDALWFTNADGHALVVSTADLSMHEVVTAPGTLVLSGPNVWAVRDDPAGRGTQVGDSTGGDRSIEHLQLGTAWGDGAGGLWVTGQARLGSAATSSDAMSLAVVTSQVAIHLDAEGRTDSTWVLRNSGQYYWAGAGGGLGLAGGDRIWILDAPT